MRTLATLIVMTACCAAAWTPSAAAEEQSFGDFWQAFKKDTQDAVDAIKDMTDVFEPDQAKQPEGTVAGDTPNYGADWVREFQSRLTSLGYQPGPVDGQFGAKTASAISAFQQQTGLPADGTPRPSVMRALRARTQGIQTAQPQAPVAPAPSPGVGGQGALAVNTIGPAQPAPGAATATGAAPAATAGGPPSFETAPEPDYRTLLAMSLAANPDGFASDTFALYHAALQLPPASDPSCQALVGALGNEISRRQITTDARARLGAVLAASPRTEQMRVFRIVTRNAAREYDFDRGGFPIESGGGSAFTRDWRYRSQPVSGTCSHRLDRRHVGSYHGHRLEIPVHVDAKAPMLAMPPQQAQIFLERNRSRRFETEWLIEVRATTAGDLAGRVLAARAREANGGTVLYNFDPATLQPPVADPAAQLAGQLAPPLSPYAAALHALKGIPDLLTKAQWLELTRIQVEFDQRAHNPAYATSTKGMAPVFTRTQVEGRLPELAAEDLAPAFREHLRELAETAPARLRAEHWVSNLVYDSTAGMLRCCQNFHRDRFDLLAVAGSAGKPPYGIPFSVAQLAHYRIQGNTPNEASATSAAIVNGLQRRYLPGIGTLGFDRKLELAGIPFERAAAEQLLLELQQSGHARRLTAVVEFAVEGVRRDPPTQGNTPVGVMLARLEQVIIRSPSGAEVARFPAEAFPKAQPAWAPTAPVEAANADQPPTNNASPTAVVPPSAPTTIAAAADPTALESSVGAPAPAPTASARGPETFQVLNLSIGMSEADALATMATEFTAEEIVADAPGGQLHATRGPCGDTAPGDPAIRAEAGSLCLTVGLDAGVVERVRLRQVVEGDVVRPAMAAFGERFGDPAFSVDPSDGSRPWVLGWGRQLDFERAALDRLALPLPPHVLEATLQVTDAVSVVVLHLDRQPPQHALAGDDAAGTEIKF